MQCIRLTQALYLEVDGQARNALTKHRPCQHFGTPAGILMALPFLPDGAEVARVFFVGEHHANVNISPEFSALGRPDEVAEISPRSQNELSELFEQECFVRSYSRFHEVDSGLRVAM